MTTTTTPDDDTEMMEVLYNGCHGGWGISNKAMGLYNTRRTETDPPLQDILFPETACRHNPLLVQIFHELGSEINSGTCSHIQSELIPKKYKNYYYIDEYDGSESVEINYDRYEKDENEKKIKNILTATHITNDQKIAELTSIFLTPKFETNIP